MPIIITTQEQAKDVDHREAGVSFKCSDCGKVKPVGTDLGAGYVANDKGGLICYSCCGLRDRDAMIREGKAVLYLLCEPGSKLKTGRSTAAELTNWPGSLRFKGHSTVGRHNMARYRYDVWFIGPDGFRWHGVTYGDNTQICRCKRTKEAVGYCSTGMQRTA